MEGRIYGEDGDFMSSLSSTPPTYTNLHNYSEKYNSEEEEHHDPTSGSTRTPKIFDRFFDSSSEEDEFVLGNGGSGGDSGLVQNAGKRIDYMIQFLDRKISLSEERDRSGQEHRGLPEFVASGGGSGIFRVPKRAAVDFSRPPSLELRPHPVRETQVGCFLKSLISVDGSQLWAGSECGVRFWNTSNLYTAGKSGEEEEAPFHQSVQTPPTLCLMADAGNRVVWSGHKDGRIRCWKMDQFLDETGLNFKDCLSWQAHHGPVLSLTITTFGDVWSGSEGGAMMIWPWEAIEKALSLMKEESHMAALLVERSYIDLKNHITVNGVGCDIFTTDVKYMVSDHSGSKVWSAGYLSFALWDVRTRDLLKVFNLSGQAENLSALHNPTVEEEVNMKYVSSFRKDKLQTPLSFFQRSRNAILGAADAVRRAAVKGAFGEDNQRTEALIIAIDGAIWTGCTNGLLVQWDGNGNHLQEFQYIAFPVHCLCASGLRIWVGYATGTIQVLDLDGNLLGDWVGHTSPIIDMAVGPGFMFSLASDGGIRAWNLTSPGPLDSILRSELAGREFLYTRLENVKILVGTWNVGQERPAHDSLISWLGSAAEDVGIVAIGLQEVEMGAGFLAVSAAKETVGLEGSAVGQWWLDMIGKMLDEGSNFHRVGSRQLAGLLIGVWVRNSIRSKVGDIDVAAVPCGFGRAIGNKGAVGLRMRLYGRLLCFVNCHFAAHLDAVNRRNADFDHVYRSMVFSRPSNLLYAAAGTSSAVQSLRGANATGINALDQMPELSDTDVLVFLGDFNYRLDGISYDEARDFISQRCFDWLKEKDQLQAEMKSGNVFQGMREAAIMFPPTYKFEKHQAGLAGYDSGEKKRIPAWCDRILYRDSRSASVSTCSLDCPVVSSVLQYEACMDVTDSDHKPVRCIFELEIARVDELVRRQEFGEIIKSNEKIRDALEEQCKVPEVIISTNKIILQNQDTSILRLTNRSGEEKALFNLTCQSDIENAKQPSSPRGSFRFPRWIEVRPTAGIIEPNHTVEILVHHQGYETLEEFVDGVPRNSWCEDARDKEVVLTVEVRSSYSTEKKLHHVHVLHSPSARTVPMKPRPANTSRIQANVLHRSNVQWLGGSFDVFEQLQNLDGP